MEILITIAYFFLVRLIFFDYKLLRFNLFWKFVVFGLYAGAADRAGVWRYCEKGVCKGQCTDEEG